MTIFGICETFSSFLSLVLLSFVVSLTFFLKKEVVVVVVMMVDVMIEDVMDEEDEDDVKKDGVKEIAKNLMKTDLFP